MTVWTIYNHGTNASSLKGPGGGEIVNLFGNNDRRPQFKGKIITEGAGSIGDPDTLVLDFKRDMGTGKYAVQPTRHESGLPGKALVRGVNMATGDGVQQNVQNTLEFIRALNLAGLCPEAINMIGWSRGAVTCIRLAYRLAQSQDPVLRNIPVNIFAVDPVAGAGHSTETDATTLMGNVKHYVATMATGELRRFFKPIAGHRLHLAAPGTTKAWVLPMPGHHGDTAKNDNHVGKLTFNLAYRFLSACGTPIPPIRHYSLDNLAAWKLYEELMTGAARVHTTGLASKIAMGGTGYSRGREAAAHLGGETFFPNGHARRLFQAAYPACFEAYFSATEAPRRNTVPWGVRHSPRIVAEQKRNGMSAAFIDRLQKLPPGGAEGGLIPPAVERMIGELGLID